MEEHAVTGPRLRIALAQVTAGADFDAVVGRAAGEGADVVVFPEMISNGYARFDPADPAARAAWIEAAEPLDGAFIGRFRAAARRHGIAVVATLLERAAPQPFNAALLIDASGEIVLHQRKRHICFFDAPEEACAAGDRSAVVRLPTNAGEVSVGMMICMDREYSDVADDLVRQGAEVVLVPNSCWLRDDPEIGDVRLCGVRAMAFEAVMAIAVANYPAPKDDGHSVIVDPLGRIVAMGGTAPDLVVGDIDLEALRRLQKSEWFRRVSPQR
ncbi:Hydrolase, carbon-nitrogen family [uncultured Pleomorphomonas sp.]|uniref:Hydrolase, carbon-nitrogen family n=1 Tax=uncultured Pleomorphomonas sp. TaxID=442121 RepID=A0A212LC99_9HYPH|nr:carbon-nitrogen hydrolase family protein [uncultured Pleomorphomonas sp.]SCM75193.1 Hydrolase, carbon-nitrogen family [uncultured Pleomorphomonas sp.]